MLPETEMYLDIMNRSKLEACYWPQNINWLWPSNAVWRHRSGSTLAHVMACWLTTPSHYLNMLNQSCQCWLIRISSVRSLDIHLRALSWGDLKIPDSKTRLNIDIVYLPSHPDLPGVNELNKHLPLHSAFQIFPGLVPTHRVLHVVVAKTFHVDGHIFLAFSCKKYMKYETYKKCEESQNNGSTVETLYNTVNFCWSTHKRHSIARPKGRGMGCLLWVQRATYCVELSKLSSIKYLL